MNSEMSRGDKDNDLPEGFLFAGGLVDRTTVTLRFAGDDLDPDELTGLLEFPPTRACRKGDERVGKNTDRKYIEKTGRWSLESPVGKGDLDAHIQWLLEILNPDQEVWDALKDRYYPDIFCGLFLDSWNRAASISATNLFELGRRGIDLSLDIYSCSSEEPDE
jgi:hypothetical protein